MCKQGLEEKSHPEFTAIFGPLDFQAVTLLGVALLGVKLHPYNLHTILQMLIIYVQTN